MVRIGKRVATGMVGALAVLCLNGCRVESNDHGDGKNVKVATPFGGMTVKTDDSTVVEGIGLPVYPGAVLTKKGDGKNNGAADVNLSFGSFQLRVKAASYTTPDSTDKVKAFYRKALARYGDVIECMNDRPVGSPTQTSEGLTCDNDKNHHIAVNDEVSGKTELRAGSKQHQHIVGIDPDGTGTKLGMVALDLPLHLSSNDNDDEQHKQ